MIDSRDAAPYGYTGRPQYNYSYNLSLSYKGFTVYALLYGIFNVNINYGSIFPFFPDYTYSVAYPWNISDKWSPELGNTEDATDRAPRYKTDGKSSGTYPIIDGSYLRLKNAEISYQIPEKLIKGTGLTNMRVYFTGYNLYTWTKDKWREDREAPGGGGNLLVSYPMMKRFTFGINIGF